MKHTAPGTWRCAWGAPLVCSGGVPGHGTAEPDGMHSGMRTKVCAWGVPVGPPRVCLWCADAVDGREAVPV